MNKGRGIYLSVLPVWVDTVALIVMPILIAVCFLLPEQRAMLLSAPANGLLGWMAEIPQMAAKSAFPAAMTLAYGLALYGGFSMAAVSAFTAKRSDAFRPALRRASLRTRGFAIVVILIMTLPFIFGGMSDGSRASSRGVSFLIHNSGVAAAAYCMFTYWIVFFATSYLHFEFSILIEWVCEKFSQKAPVR